MHHDEASAFGGEDNTFRIWWVERQRERSGMQLGRVVEVDRIRDPTQLYPATARALDERLGGLQFGGFYGGQPSEALGQVGGGRRDRIPTSIFGSIWRRCLQEGSVAPPCVITTRQVSCGGPVSSGTSGVETMC